GLAHRGTPFRGAENLAAYTRGLRCAATPWLSSANPSGWSCPMRTQFRTSNLPTSNCKLRTSNLPRFNLDHIVGGGFAHAGRGDPNIAGFGTELSQIGSAQVTHAGLDAADELGEDGIDRPGRFL